MRAGDPIPDAVLDRAVSGLNLAPGTLRDQLGEGVDLLVFLRHFGCIFCRETLADVRALAQNVPHFPTPLFFFQGSAAEGRALLRHSWPELRAVADPNAGLYQAFGIGRGGLLEMFGPGVWSGMSRARGKGLSNGQRSGDIWRMPGTYLVADERILWMHEHRHAADRPDYAEISRLAAARTRAARATA